MGTMEKPVYKSKTVWGVFLFALANAVVQLGWLPQNVATTLVEALGVFLGGWGIRDAL